MGICTAGSQTCSGGNWGACVGEVLPGVEVCDGDDDDCDGTVDDGNPGGGGACGTGLNGICATGVVNCVSGALQCDQTVFPVAEVCGNALDDDCDGSTDEGCGSTVTLDAINRGWWNNSGSHTSSNDNTYTGLSISGLYNSYFSFDLSGLSGTVTSVELRLELENYYGTDASETCSIWDVSTPAATLEASGTNVAIYNDLMTGNQYGTNVFLQTGVGTVYTIPLGAQAIADVQAALGSDFSVGVHVDTITLPSGSEGVRFSMSTEARVHQLVLNML